MQLLRLSAPDDVLAHWSLFREGHRTLRQMSNSVVTEDEYCKILTNLSIRGDDVCIMVVRDGERDICYGVACNSTPPHSDRKTYEVTTTYNT